jgi:hypothetical protein
MSAMVVTVIAAALTALQFTTVGQRSNSATAGPVLVPASDLLARASGGTIAGGTTGVPDGAAPRSSQATGTGGTRTTISEVADISHSDDKLALAGSPASFALVPGMPVDGEILIRGETWPKTRVVP